MTHRPARVHELHSGPIKALDATTDRIATGGADGAVRLLTSDGEHIARSTAHRDLVNSVAIGPGSAVTSGSRDRSIRLFDPAIARSYIVGEHDHWVMGVAWAHDGTRIASASEDGTIGIWEPDGASVQRIDVGGPVNGIDWKGDVIAAAGGTRQLMLYDGDGNLRRSLPGGTQLLWSVALSPDASHVAWVGRDRWLRIVAVAGGEPTVVPAHDAQIFGVSWDGDRIVTASADGSVGIWSPQGEPLERVGLPAWGRRARLMGVELLVATEDGTLHVFDSDGMDPAAVLATTIEDPPAECTHWDPVVTEAPPRPRCEECGSLDEPRLCVTCGHVGCCESQLAHGTKHWLATGHPNTVPAIPGPYPWRWCYADDMYVKG